MKLGSPAVVGAIGSLVIVAGIFSGLAQPEGAASAPQPTDVPISVVIPELSPSPTGGGGGGGGGGGTCTPAVGDESPIPATQPSDKAGVLALDVETIRAGELMLAKGGGYTPREQVQVVIYPGAVVVESFEADAGGNLVARFRIPIETRPGDHVVEAGGWQSCVANKADFSVVTDSAASFIPYLWWVIAVLGVLLASIIVTAIYFRHSIRRSFGSGLQPAGPST